MNTHLIRISAIGGMVAIALLVASLTGNFLGEREYVVSESDMVGQEPLLETVATSSLETAVRDDLIRLREEEKLARDVYTVLGAQWGMRIFANIARSEQTHTDAIARLLARYGISDPVAVDTPGVFTSPVLQTLYADLVARGVRTRAEALAVGATIEDLDIHDIETFKAGSVPADILSTYENLQRGSRNHMRAFIASLKREGVWYEPAYISMDMFEAIIDGEQERGPGR